MITTDLDRGVALVTLDRPPVNALDEAMLDGLVTAVSAVADASEVGAVLVRGAGRAFSAGADVAMISTYLEAEDRGEQLVAFGARLQHAYARIETLPVPVVAAIVGAATGGGLELALACDLRIAADNARLGLPEVHLGLLAAAGGTQRLTRIAGPAVASRLILTGELVSGAEAARLGFVHHAVPLESLEEEALALARRLAALPRGALAAAKHCIALAPSEQGYRAETEGTRGLLEDPATIERVDAFLGRRRSEGSPD